VVSSLFGMAVRHAVWGLEIACTCSSETPSHCCPSELHCCRPMLFNTTGTFNRRPVTTSSSISVTSAMMQGTKIYRGPCDRISPMSSSGDDWKHFCCRVRADHCALQLYTYLCEYATEYAAVHLFVWICHRIFSVTNFLTTVIKKLTTQLTISYLLI